VHQEGLEVQEKAVKAQ